MFLLDRGAKPEGAAELAGYTPLHWAASRYENPITYGPVDAPGEWTAIVGVPDRGAKLTLIRALVAHGASVDAPSTKPLPSPLLVPGAGPVGGASTVGGTAFFIAAHSGDPEVMRLLLALGANPEARARDGSTAVMAAAAGNIDYAVRIPEADRLEAVRLGLDLGVDIEAQDSKGQRAMHAAANAGYHQIIRFLLAQGADLNPKTKDRQEGPLLVSRLPWGWSRAISPARSSSARRRPRFSARSAPSR
jgi:hypothetical protein